MITSQCLKLLHFLIFFCYYKSVKKTLLFFVIISIFIFVLGFTKIGLLEKENIKNFSVLTKGAYLVTGIGNLKLDDSKPLISTPFPISNGTKISSAKKSGALIILGTGEELGLGENTSIRFLNNKKLELLSGNLHFLNLSTDSIFLKWKNHNFIVKDKASFSIIKVKKSKNLTNEILQIKVEEGFITSLLNNQANILKKRFSYTLNDNGIISETQLLPPPKLIEPEDSKNISIDEGSNLIFKWEKITGAKSYNFYFSYDPLFINPKIINTKDTMLSLHITDFQESPVRWKVCAVKSTSQKGICSKVRNFHIKNLIQILQLWKTPPLLEIEEPLTPTGNLVIIKGKTDLGVNLTINGEEVTIDSSGKFMHILKFNTIGEHQIKIVAKNLSGAKKVYTKNVIIYER